MPQTWDRYPSFKTPGGIVRLLDYVGTVSFAMSGAAAAGMRGLNLLGCMFVGVLAATGGGTLRDLLLGQTPVFWLVEVRVPAIERRRSSCGLEGVVARRTCLLSCYSVALFLATL